MIKLKNVFNFTSYYNFFKPKIKVYNFRGYNQIRSIGYFLGDYLSKEEVFKYLKNYDIIVPSEGVYNLHSVKKEFINYYIFVFLALCLYTLYII